MKLQRYDIDTVRGVFGETLLERDYRDDGNNVDAYEAFDVIEALELAVERATANMVAAQNRAAELEEAMREISEMEVCDCDCYDDDERCPTCVALEALGVVDEA
jgi:hypothetical protein